MKRLVLSTVVGLAGCAPTTMALHVPSLSPQAARAPTAVELEPIAAPKSEGAVVVHGSHDVAGGRPEAVLTDGIRTELAARALHGGERGGYVATCRLDRFATRDLKDDGLAFVALYADAACDVARKADRALVWRGELRARTASIARTSVFDSDDAMWQTLHDRVTSDATREMASDLAIGVLGLHGSPSGRVFPNEEAERQLAGVDDVVPYGAWALSLDVGAAEKLVAAGDLRSPDMRVRVAAWNAVAMAALPGRPWVAGVETVVDDDAWVRFYQYKALARYASGATLTELKLALKRENQDVLKELLKDAIATGGIGPARTMAASADTNGTTTSP